MPQWDFLDFLAEQGEGLSDLSLLCRPKATDLSKRAAQSSGCGRRPRTATSTIRADLVIGADGRHSTVRECAGLRSRTSARRSMCSGCGCRARRRSEADARPDRGGRASSCMIYRGDYWQCALVIAEGRLRRRSVREGLDAFRARLVAIAPFLRRPRRRDRKLRRREAADRDGRPAAALVAARASLHRRRGACHVAGRRRRHQPRGPGCRRRVRISFGSAAPDGAVLTLGRLGSVQARR